FGVFIHNFPEGMATFIGTITEIQLGVLLTVAIALHNIPEGIAVAVPIYACTFNKKKAFKWSFISGMSEPLGAIITWLILFPFINDLVLGALLGAVGGIMVYISLDELLPVARSLAKEHYSILGIMTGMFIMSMSLVII
ncbi:MAG: ZIP family metal transporter, partial [Candidatus Thorarchaeota archaeon]